MVDQTNNPTPAELAQAEQAYANLQAFQNNAFAINQRQAAQAAQQRAAQAAANDAETKRRQNWTPPTAKSGKRGR